MSGALIMAIIAAVAHDFAHSQQRTEDAWLALFAACSFAAFGYVVEQMLRAAWAAFA